MSKSLAERLYSGGFPAVTTTQPSGTRCLPKTLYCRNCSMAGARVSDTQLISSRNRMPSRTPVRSIWSYTEAMISLIVYSLMRQVLPSNSRSVMKGSPRALCRV